MNKKCEKLEKFLEKYPQFKGKVIGYKSDRGGLGISRIDNDWYECSEYLVEFEDIEKALEKK